jgi:hypothetical protein
MCYDNLMDMDVAIHCLLSPSTQAERNEGESGFMTLDEGLLVQFLEK